MTPDRTPPHSYEAEQCALGAMLASPQCIDLAVVKLQAGAFYDLRHQTIYDTMRAIREERKPVDIVSVMLRLKDAGQIENVGGAVYLSQLTDSPPSPENIGYFLDVIAEKHIMRRIIEVCRATIDRVFGFEGEIDHLVDGFEGDALAIGQARVDDEAPTMKALIGRAIDEVEACHNSKGAIRGVATGYADLDRMTRGLKPGEMIVIAARPSMGKTSLALNIAEHVAADAGAPVGVFSLEMSADSLALRMLCSRARVNMINIRDGFLSDRDFPKMTHAAGQLQRAPIHIDDSSGLSILKLKAKARRMYQRHGIKLLVIDYLQLLHSTARTVASREREIADISQGIKALAKELGIPIIVLSQLSRESEKEKRKPRLSDLRESGAIEQDADLVGLIYRPESNGPDSPDAGMPVRLLIAKQRSGPTGEVELLFFRALTRFESVARVPHE